MTFFKKNKRSGFSLIEIIISLSIFVVISAITVSILQAGFRGSKKSDVTSIVRQNGDYAIAVMERVLRNAKSYDSCQNNQIQFTDQYGSPNRIFSCETDRSICPSGGCLASGSASLKSPITSADVVVFSCQITCVNVTPSPLTPTTPTVNISFSVKQANVSGLVEQTGSYSVSTQVVLRNR